jgi:hypothetical protein
LKLQFCTEAPGKIRPFTMWPLAMAGCNVRPNSGEVPPRLGREIVGGGARAHIGLICALIGGREAAGGGGRRHPVATAAGALAPVRRLLGLVRGQDGEQQQGQERVEGTTVGARGRWNLSSPRRSSLAPADGSGRGGRVSGRRSRQGGGGSHAQRGASGPYRWLPPCCADEHRGSVRRRRHSLPLARPPRRLGARGLGSRGGLW